MAAITAAMVKALREKTDAPMMECKKALTEADGDAAKAEEILRVKLGNKASKAASRVTAEGVIGTYVSPDGKTGAIVEVNSETDFVAKNPEFLKMAADAAKLIAEKAPADVAALSALELEGKTLDAIRTALVGKIGENMTFRRFKRLEAKGKLHKYVHGGSKIATLVDVEGGDDEVAHDIAMHIAASKPKALNAEGIDPALIETERRVAIEKAKEAGNSMFFGSHEGASRAAILYSIAISCRLNGINLFEYICDVIEKTVEWQPNTPLEKYRNLLPDRWKKQ